MRSLNVFAKTSSCRAFRKTLLTGLIFLLGNGLLVQSSFAQCDTPDPAITSTAPFWTNFDVDGNVSSDEFGILHYFTGSKILAYNTLVNVYTVGGELMNVPDGVSFDGTEDISGSGEYLDLAAGDWQVIFKYLPDNRLGFLNFTVTNDGVTSTPDSIMVTRIALQEIGDTDGIISGQCSSLGVAAPIELASFEASAQEESILLEWVTATEIDNLGFDIQRSTDGRQFESIGWEEGQGFSSRAVAYSFVDKDLQKNITYYYRLVNRDRTGGGQTSPLKTAQIRGDRYAEVSPIFPNPVFGNQTKVQVIGQKNTTAELSLFNSQGQRLQYRQLEISKGINNFELEVGLLPSGQYLVLVQNDKEFTRRKFIISR